MQIEITRREKVDVRYLKVDADVRYWEDATVNGETDNDGKLIPCRFGNSWAPVIDLETGFIQDWPEGTTAEVHYKVCDAGVYTLLDADMCAVKSIDGYVPDILSPGEPGWGDYIILSIDGDGKIACWDSDLDQFEEVTDA